MEPILKNYPPDGFLRLPQIIGRKARKETNREGKAPLPARDEIIGIFPMSKSKWWAGVKSGVFPKPVKLGPNTTAWKVQDIVILIQKLSNPVSKTAQPHRSASIHQGNPPIAASGIEEAH